MQSSHSAGRDVLKIPCSMCAPPKVKSWILGGYNRWVWMRSAEHQSRGECWVINSAAGRAVVRILFTAGGCPVAVTTQKFSSPASFLLLLLSPQVCMYVCVAYFCLYVCLVCVCVCVCVCTSVVAVEPCWNVSWVVFLTWLKRKYESNRHH